MDSGANGGRASEGGAGRGLIADKVLTLIELIKLGCFVYSPHEAPPVGSLRMMQLLFHEPAPFSLLKPDTSQLDEEIN